MGILIVCRRRLIEETEGGRRPASRQALDCSSSHRLPGFGEEALGEKCAG